MFPPETNNKCVYSGLLHMFRGEAVFAPARSRKRRVYDRAVAPPSLAALAGAKQRSPPTALRILTVIFDKCGKFHILLLFFCKMVYNIL
jgi:hypothetical protein